MMRLPYSPVAFIFQKILFACLGVLACSTHVYAQHQFFYKDVFDKYAGIEATPRCMVEDQDGFLWIGAQKGLYRFDGSLSRRVRFAPDDSLSDKNNDIRDLAIDNRQSILWLATSGGIFKYYLKSGISEHYSAEQFYARNEYTFPSCVSIYIDRQSFIWANFAAPGLSCIYNGGQGLQHYTCEPDSTPGEQKPPWANANSILCIAQDARQDSILWAGTKAGLIRFNRVTKKIRHFYYTLPDKLLESRANPMHHILPHVDGKIYLGTYNGGLLVFDPVFERFYHFLPHPESVHLPERKNNIDFLAPQSRTKLWVSNGKDLLLFDTKFRRFTKVAQNIDIDFIDQQGNFWGFGSGTLTLYHRGKNQINRIQYPDAEHFKVSDNLRLWEDTTAHKIYARVAGLSSIPVYDRLQNQWKLLTLAKPNKDKILGHVLEKTDRGLLVNDARQFYLLKPGAKKITPYPLSMPDNPGWIISMQSPDGNIYFTNTKGYLMVLKPGARDVDTYFRSHIGEPFSEHFLYPTVSGFDQRNRAWIICQGGFSIFDPATSQFIHIPNKPDPEHQFEQYRGFALDKTGRMWCEGANAIGWMNPDRPEQGIQERFDRTNGYALKDMAGGFFFDKKGMLWFNTADNLAKFDPTTRKLQLFEGFRNDHSSLLTGGELAFLNARGIGIIHPDSLQPNTEIPQPYIAWLKVFDKEKNLTGNLLAPEPLKLNPTENFFSIGFSALGFFNGSKLQFAYQLEGVDPKWVFPEPNVRLASYTGLKGGDYVFRLKVATSLGVWNETALEWPIHIGTPWWMTRWFKLLALGLSGLTLYILINNHLKQQKTLIENQRLLLEKEHTLRNERDRIASDMHDDLGAGLSTIRMLSLTAKYYTTTPEQIKRIDTIAQTAADVMEKMSEIVWVMNSKNDSLESTIAFICRYAGEYLDAHNIYLTYELPALRSAVVLSGIQRRNLLLAAKECLHNIVKHAEATEVRLLFSTHGFFHITIIDNGKGIPASILEAFKNGDKRLMGNGLHNLQQRMIALGGGVKISVHGITRIELQTGIKMAT